MLTGKFLGFNGDTENIYFKKKKKKKNETKRSFSSIILYFWTEWAQTCFTEHKSWNDTNAKLGGMGQALGLSSSHAWKRLNGLGSLAFLLSWPIVSPQQWRWQRLECNTHLYLWMGESWRVKGFFLFPKDNLENVMFSKTVGLNCLKHILSHMDDTLNIRPSFCRTVYELCWH